MSPRPSLRRWTQRPLLKPCASLFLIQVTEASKQEVCAWGSRTWERRPSQHRLPRRTSVHSCPVSWVSTLNPCPLSKHKNTLHGSSSHLRAGFLLPYATFHRRSRSMLGNMNISVGPPISIMNQENAQQACPQASAAGSFSGLRFPL